MPTCNECKNPCNCVIEEDGPYANRPNDGRRSTTVKGNGTAGDPYVISFMQSREYLPASGQITASNVPTVSGTAGIVTVNNSDPVITWESPDRVFAFFPTGSDFTYVFERFNMVGATVTFAAHATGTRRLAIFGTKIDGTDFFIAGDQQLGNSSRPTVLSASGFSAGVVADSSLEPAAINPRINGFGVGVYQNSGTALPISTLTFWVTTI